jgi:hypothetical protein
LNEEASSFCHPRNEAELLRGNAGRNPLLIQHHVTVIYYYLSDIYVRCVTSADDRDCSKVQRGIDDARVTESETLVRRGKKWFRYDAPDKQLFKELQKTLTGR